MTLSRRYQIRADDESWEEDRPFIPSLSVEDSDKVIDTGLVTKDGVRIVRIRESVDWFGFVPLEEH